MKHRTVPVLINIRVWQTGTHDNGRNKDETNPLLEPKNAKKTMKKKKKNNNKPRKYLCMYKYKCGCHLVGMRMLPHVGFKNINVMVAVAIAIEEYFSKATQCATRSKPIKQKNALCTARHGT